MKYVYLLFIISILTACGGGGGGGGETSTPINTSPSISSRVIDGYISGANVFIDFNYNLIQDVGEPSAIEEDGKYNFSFSGDTFSAIKNVSIDCAYDRIQVAEVPAGATDTELGTVNEAFTMYYVPYLDGNANISPFTGLFLDFLDASKKEVESSLSLNNDQSLEINVEDGCGTNANNIAAKINSKVLAFADDLDSYGTSLSQLYDDYIASNNNQRKQKAEKIVNFLKIGEKIKSVIDTHYGNKYKSRLSLSDESLAKIFGTDDFTSLPFSIWINNIGNADENGWKPVMTFFTSGLKLLSNGKIAKATCTETDANNCQQFDTSYANIMDNIESYASYGGSKNSKIIDGVSIESRFRESRTRDNEGGLDCSKAAKLDLQGIKPCTGDNCPDQIKFEYEITHNLGFNVSEKCTNSDNPYVYVFSQRINKEITSVDRYGIQFSLKPGNQIYSNPPVNFLGANKNNLNYKNTFNLIEGLLVTMGNIDPLVEKLSAGEFISVFRQTESKENSKSIDGTRYTYVVNKGSDGLTYSCNEYEWNNSSNSINLDNPTETQGVNAYSTCYNKINSFNFFN